MADNTRVTDVPLLLVERGNPSIGRRRSSRRGVGCGIRCSQPCRGIRSPRTDGLPAEMGRPFSCSERRGCDADVDGKALCRGRDRRLERSSSLVVGGIAFRLKLPMTADTAGSGGLIRGSRSLGAGFAAGVAGIATLAATALIASPSLPPPMRFPVGSLEMTGGGAAKVDATAPQATHARDSAALLKDFRQQLASAGLDEVTVNIQSDGAVEAVGRIGPAKGEAWRAAVRWFDTARHGPAVLVDRVNVAARGGFAAGPGRLHGSHPLRHRRRGAEALYRRQPAGRVRDPEDRKRERAAQARRSTCGGALLMGALQRIGGKIAERQEVAVVGMLVLTLAMMVMPMPPIAGGRC